MPPLAEILDGVALDKVAIPPLIDKAKSPTSNDPLPPLVLYTASAKVTAIVALLEARATAETVGTVVSIMSALFAPRELVSPGAARVNIAAFPTASAMVPLLSARAFVLS